MSIQFTDFNTYFTILAHKRYINEANHNMNILKKINKIGKNKNIKSKYKKFLINLNNKAKNDFDMSIALYKNTQQEFT